MAERNDDFGLWDATQGWGRPEGRRLMDWKDLDAEAQRLKNAQDAIERQIAAMGDDPNPELLQSIGWM
jgi:hypothetical protein